MGSKQRLGILLVIVAALAIANFYTYFFDRDMGGTSFWISSDDLSANYSAKVKKTMADIERIPALSLEMTKTGPRPDEEQQRNPFVFGIDRRKEEEQQQRLREIQETREQYAKELATTPIIVSEPQRPEFEGEVIGIMRSHRTGKKKVSLQFEGELFILEEGETLADRYQILTIAFDLVRIRSIEHGHEIEIPLATD